MDQSRWNRIVEWPLTFAAVVFLVAYSWEVIADPGGSTEATLELVLSVTWAVFLLDYIVNLALAEARWRWFRSHVPGLLVVALPLLRPLRLLRLVTLVSVLQRTIGSAFRVRVVTYVVGASVLLVYVAALAILDSERAAPGANITNLGDALWWAFVTITTVGYGDFTPVTIQGRFIAAALMVGGVALIGTVTATLASWIVQRVETAEEDASAATRGEVRALTQQIAELTAALNRGQHG